MSHEWQTSLFRARKGLIAFSVVTGLLILLGGVITAGALVWASVNSNQTENPASQQFTAAAKIQTIADSLNCVKLGSACPDFDHMNAYLDLLIQDSAEFSTPAHAAILTKNPDGWKIWAAEVTRDTSGSPSGIEENGSNVYFRWGAQKYTATFATVGNATRLAKLTKGNDVP